MKYTPTPWIVEQNEHDKLGQRARILGPMIEEDGKQKRQWIATVLGHETSLVNAQRIVECVNALAGADDEQIANLQDVINEGTVALAERDTLKSELEFVTKQRDKLLEALKDIKTFVDNDFPPKVALGKRSPKYTEAWKQMNEIIELVERDSK